MAEQVLVAAPEQKLTDAGRSGIAPGSGSPRPSISATDLILDILTRCATAFGTERARFLRQVHMAGWHVHTMQHGALTTHTADYAEIAMAWMVGLSRFPIRVTRPRVTLPDGSGVRPIAVTSYFGIPVLCQDHFVGVIELAGNVKGDLERTLGLIADDLARFGERMTHDPAARPPALVDLDTECRLDGGCWYAGTVSLDNDQWSVVSALKEPLFVRDLIQQVPLEAERIVDVVHSLTSLGLISVRAATHVLAATETSGAEPLATAGDD